VPKKTAKEKNGDFTTRAWKRVHKAFAAVVMNRSDLCDITKDNYL